MREQKGILAMYLLYNEIWIYNYWSWWHAWISPHTRKL